MTAGLAVMPDLHGVISALKAVHTDSLPSTLTNTAVEFITQNLSSSAVGQQFETLINDGVAARAVDGIFRRSVSAAGPSFTPSHAAPTGRGGNGDYGSNSDDFFYSLEYQSAERCVLGGLSVFVDMTAIFAGFGVLLLWQQKEGQQRVHNYRLMSCY